MSTRKRFYLMVLVPLAGALVLGIGSLNQLTLVAGAGILILGCLTPLAFLYWLVGIVSKK